MWHRICKPRCHDLDDDIMISYQYHIKVPNQPKRFIWNDANVPRAHRLALTALAKLFSICEFVTFWTDNALGTPLYFPCPIKHSFVSRTPWSGWENPLSNRFCSSRKHAQWHHVHHHPNVCLPRQPMATATGNREHTISATSLSWPDTDWRKRCWWQRRLRYHHSPPGPIQEDLRNSYPCHRKDHNNKYNDNI